MPEEEKESRFTGEYEKVGHEPVTEEELELLRKVLKKEPTPQEQGGL